MTTETTPDSALLLILVGVALVAVHSHPRWPPVFRLLNAGSIALSIGLVTGLLVALFYDLLDRPVPLPFNFDLYMFCLPVFVYHQGLSTKSHRLFKNIVALVVLGVVGTIASSILISFVSYRFLGWVDIGLTKAELFRQSVALGVILSSTDSVAALTAIQSRRTSPNPGASKHSELFYLVFGEGIFNDATAIVLLRSASRLSSAQGDAVSVGLTFVELSAGFAWMMLASLFVGLGVGLLSAYVLRRWFNPHRSTDREVAMLLTTGLLSYFLAEQLGLSGVFAIFFCGVTQSHYAWYNLSASARIVSIYSSRVMSVVAEIVLFVGTSLSLFGEWDTIDYTKGRMMRKVLVVAPSLFTLVVVSRWLVIMPLLAALRIRDRTSVFLAGSVRGAVTLALAVFHFLGHGSHLKHHEIILCASVIFIVVASTIGLGTLVAYVFERKREGDEDAYQGYEPLPLPPPTGGDVGSGSRERMSLKQLWVDFDRRVMQPVFGGKAVSSVTAASDARRDRSPYEQQQQQGEGEGEGEEDHQSLLDPLFSLADSRSLSLQRAEVKIDAAILGNASL